VRRSEKHRTTAGYFSFSKGTPTTAQNYQIIILGYFLFQSIFFAQKRG
jgi:hypothetical protein